MMHTAERHRELIAHFATEGPGLCERRLWASEGWVFAHNTGLRRDKLAVELVAQPARSGRDSIMLKIWELCCGQCRASAGASSDGDGTCGTTVSR